MAKKIPYPTNDDKYRRLEGTVCLWKGEPYYVTLRNGYGMPPLGHEEVNLLSINDSNKIKTKGSYITVNYTEDDFVYRCIELGYMNYDGSAYFLGRMPNREFHQGLSENNIYDAEGKIRNRSGWFGSKSLYDCILGKHPTLDEVMERIGDVESIAFDRNFAVAKLDRKRLLLKHRGQVIGWMSADDSKFSVFKNRSNAFIQPILDEKKIPYILGE